MKDDAAVSVTDLPSAFHVSSLIVCWFSSGQVEGNRKPNHVLLSTILKLGTTFFFMLDCEEKTEILFSLSGQYDKDVSHLVQFKI